jgi:hypothetical protein
LKRKLAKPFRLRRGYGGQAGFLLLVFSPLILGRVEGAAVEGLTPVSQRTGPLYVVVVRLNAA